MQDGFSMETALYKRLVQRRLLTENELENCIAEARKTPSRIEDVLLGRGVPKHEILLALSAYYGYPFVEYDESVIVSRQITRRMDMERLKRSLWLPLSIGPGRAEVIACSPDDPSLRDEIRSALSVTAIDFRIALPSDLVRIIEHNQDLNPRFPPVAGRTPLAKVRTFLAERRSALSCQRTALAKGRTGLALLRTGLSFITISLVLFRVFGMNLVSILEAALFIAGVAAAADGLIWYLPVRFPGRKTFACGATLPTGGTSVLAAVHAGDAARFSRTSEVQGAESLRAEWSDLSPVMRRRFLAADRTDLAEERTVLACYRTEMARARTGLAFMRTGTAFIGLGIALLRQFPAGAWTSVDAAVIIMGSAMVAEGFYWYLPGRKAGAEGKRTVTRAESNETIWDVVFPFLKHNRALDALAVPRPLLKGYQSPGIWGTTGLALERTLLADRRNVMARLRTVMARSRTGMAFLRTGISLASIGLGLLVYFGAASLPWTVLKGAMICAGALCIGDGLAWYLPAERTRRQFPYCFGEMEIVDADYGRPAREWRKAVFSHDEI